MATLIVDNPARGTRLAERASEARTFGRRFLGLMGRTSLPPGEGLHILPCNSVHTFFMRLPIDVLILDREHRVVKLFANLRPWRVTPLVRAGRSVLELPAGTAAATGTQEGDLLAFRTQL